MRGSAAPDVSMVDSARDERHASQFHYLRLSDGWKRRPNFDQFRQVVVSVVECTGKCSCAIQKTRFLSGNPQVVRPLAG